MTAGVVAVIVGQHFCAWSVKCDGCERLLTVACKTDRAAIEFVLERAAELGWLIESDRFIRPRLDLCPACRSRPRSM